MEKIYILLSIITLAFISNAQIGGLSASKTTTLSATTISAHQIEFEPSFCIIHENGSFDNSFNFRFSYGVCDKLETGISLPVDVKGLSYGVKYLLVDNKFKFSPIAGANFDFTANNFLTDIGAGFASTYQFTDNYSADLDFHYLTNFNNLTNLSIGFDNGLYIDKLQLILGLNYLQFTQYNHFSNELLLNPGITIEYADNFLLVLVVSKSIITHNLPSSLGFAFALTITIE